MHWRVTNGPTPVTNAFVTRTAHRAGIYDGGLYGCSGWERILRIGRRGGRAPTGRALFLFLFSRRRGPFGDLKLPARQFPKNPSPGVTSRGRQEELSRMIRLNPKHPYNPPS